MFSHIALTLAGEDIQDLTVMSQPAAQQQKSSVPDDPAIISAVSEQPIQGTGPWQQRPAGKPPSSCISVSSIAQCGTNIRVWHIICAGSVHNHTTVWSQLWCTCCTCSCLWRGESLPQDEGVACRILLETAGERLRLARAVAVQLGRVVQPRYLSQLPRRSFRNVLLSAG